MITIDGSLILGQNLINHLGVYRRKLVEKVGGFRLGYEGSQDYDLALRVMRRCGVAVIRRSGDQAITSMCAATGKDNASPVTTSAIPRVTATALPAA